MHDINALAANPIHPPTIAPKGPKINPVFTVPSIKYTVVIPPPTNPPTPVPIIVKPNPLSRVLIIVFLL